MSDEFVVDKLGEGEWAGANPEVVAFDVSKGRTSIVRMSEAEREAIETLAAHLPAPGTRCPTCHRRVNKPRKDDSPPVREVRFRGPSDRVDAAEEGLDALQEFTGVDPYSYPRIELLEKLLALGAQHREELKTYFEGAE